MKTTFRYICILICATVAAHGAEILRIDFAKPVDFYKYGTWETAVHRIGDGLRIGDPATDMGGLGVSMRTPLAVPPGSKVKLVARVDEGSEVRAFNVVLHDLDGEEGKRESYVFEIPISQFPDDATFREVEFSIDDPPLTVLHAIDEQPNFTPSAKGLAGVEIQGNYNEGAPIRITVKSLVIESP